MSTGEFMDVPSPPPFADPSSIGSKILNGVNFASAAGGILDESGRHYVLNTLVSIILNFVFLTFHQEINRALIIYKNALTIEPRHSFQTNFYFIFCLLCEGIIYFSHYIMQGDRYSLSQQVFNFNDTLSKYKT